MDALEYLRQRQLLCETQQDLHPDDWAEYCSDCPLKVAYPATCRIFEHHRPAEAVRIVEEWADAKRCSGDACLSVMDERFARNYIDKGFLWAARDRDGGLVMYSMEPVRVANEFFRPRLPEIRICQWRVAYSHMLPSITWENSPMYLPRLLERGTP